MNKDQVSNDDEAGAEYHRIVEIEERHIGHVLTKASVYDQGYTYYAAIRGFEHVTIQFDSADHIEGSEWITLLNPLVVDRPLTSRYPTFLGLNRDRQAIPDNEYEFVATQRGLCVKLADIIAVVDSPS